MRNMEARVLVAFLIIFVICISDAVDYDNWDDSVPAEVLSQPVGIDVGSVEEKGHKLWPNRTGIPYMIDHIFNQSQQIIIQQALRKIERSTGGCVMFKKRTDEKDYALFKWSFLTCGTVPGMQGGEQLVYLTDECTADQRVLQHEIMHLLGFDHEHSRPDRNDYINLQYAEIPFSLQKDFRIEPLAHTYGTKYDYNSITHYSAFAGSSSGETGRPVLVPKKGLIRRMGRYNRLSPGDVAKIKIGYKCPLRIRTTSAEHMTDVSELFPNFSLEPMSYTQCKLLFNDYCASNHRTKLLCDTSKGLTINCLDNAPESVLREISVGMAEGALRPVFIVATERNLATYSFAPLRRQVISLYVRNCTTNRVTGRLTLLSFSNLLEFQMIACPGLVVMKGDFASSRKLRIIDFAGCIITTLQMHTFTNLPDLQIITMEKMWNGERSEYDRFDGPMQTYLYNLHCSCEFAWYRQWWRANKKLKLSAEKGELYSIAAAFEHAVYKKEDLYHPINCKASPFPLGTQWINYYTQIEYSINEPNCENFQRCRNVLQALSSDCI